MGVFAVRQTSWLGRLWLRVTNRRPDGSAAVARQQALCERLEKELGVMRSQCNAQQVLAARSLALKKKSVGTAAAAHHADALMHLRQRTELRVHVDRLSSQFGVAYRTLQNLKAAASRDDTVQVLRESSRTLELFGRYNDTSKLDRALQRMMEADETEAQYSDSFTEHSQKNLDVNDTDLEEELALMEANEGTEGDTVTAFSAAAEESRFIAMQPPVRNTLDSTDRDAEAGAERQPLLRPPPFDPAVPESKDVPADLRKMMSSASG